MKTGLPQPSSDDDQAGAIARRSNWLRAGVLGANDGIVSAGHPERYPGTDEGDG